MDNSKTLLDLFKRYTPPPEYVDILKSAKNIIKRVDTERKTLDVEAELDFPVSKEILYDIETQVCKTYQINSVRIYPKYKKDHFGVSYIPQILLETQRLGAVARGFFNDYSIGIDDKSDPKTITLNVFFNDGGVNLLYDATTPDLIEKIIKNEFGLDYKVIIKTDINYKLNYETFEKQQREKLIDITMSNENEIEAGNGGGYGSAKKEAPADEPENPDLPEAPSIYTNAVTFETVTDFIYKIGYMTFNTENRVHIFGEEFKILPIPIRDVEKSKRKVVVLGEIFSFEKKISKNGDKTIINFSVTDEDMSVNVKCTIPNEDADPIINNLKKGKVVAVKGTVKTDEYNDNETIIELSGLALIDKIERADNAEKKRVELHLHTNMSAMDALITPDKLLKTAKRWGHKAIAVTDHGNVQTFPEIMDEKEKQKLDIKIIYGMEAYFVDDTARAVFGTNNALFSDEFIVFDIETTGLSAMQDKITEIGAVLIKDGNILKEFHTYVNPRRQISKEITDLTGITDEMVADAPLDSEAVKAFLKFSDDRILIAHNANFDIGFLRKVADDNKLRFNNSYIDTLSLSRYLNPELKSHRLNIIAAHYKIGDFDHHRALDDTVVLAKIFFHMVDKLKKEGIKDIENMVKSMSDKADPLKLPAYHMIILVKNPTGLKNLYKLVSVSYLNYFHRIPRIPKTILNDFREGLIIGSACESGELFSAIKNNRSESEIKSIAEYYDYLEIQPLSNNRFLINEGTAKNDGDLENFNRHIVKLGEELNKPVVATSDAHFINKHDEIFRKILMTGMKYSDADRDVGIYLKTTEEMLEEFEYLGKEKAYETVVVNSNLIAGMIEEIRPIPKGTFTPHIDGADVELYERCYAKAKKTYGDPLPEIVASRLEKEITSIIKNGFTVLYIIAIKLIEYSEQLGYIVGSRGSVGSSFVAAMAGITEVNPLPPHYWCENENKTFCYCDFSVDLTKYASGFDLPEKKCPNCGRTLKQDGQDIPFETFMGFYGEKSPDIDLNFSGDIQAKVHKYTEQLFGSENVFRAGTIGTLADKTAYGFVAKYLENSGISLRKAEINRIISNCIGVKRTTGQHPGGIIVIPNGKEVYDFTPVQHPADDPDSNIITTHFAFSYLHETVLKLDELGHDIPTKYKVMEEYTNVKINDIPLNDPAVYELFKSTKSLNVSPDEIDCKLGTFGLPEMGTRFIQQVLLEGKPQTFADLLQISGLTHGTDVWLGNAQELIKKGICTISEVVGIRDNIMLYLINKGIDNGTAYKITEDVRKGKGLEAGYEKIMRENNVPDWYIASCKKIKYMFPKAHATAYVMSALRLGWYKIYRPLEFYAAFFTVAPGGFDGELVMKGKAEILKVIREIEGKGNQVTQKENETVTTFQLINEFYARGFKFLPVALYKSASHAFLIEDGKVRLPYSSLPGLGDNAALKIYKACNDKDNKEEKVFSIEDLQHKAQLSKSVVEILNKNGVLKGLSETNQIKFF